MLVSLSIKNFLIIESVYVDFSEGLSVITGETGAGKSILIDALMFCFGAKMENHIRKNSQQCSVIVELDIKLNEEIKRFLEEHSIEHDDTLIIKRQDHLSQRKKFFVNDQQVTQKLINQISAYLLEIHGQHSNAALLDPRSHLDILDSYADLSTYKKKLQESYKKWQENTRKISDISTQREKNIQEISYLDFITNELRNAAIKPEEENDLLNQRSKLQQTFNQQKTIQQALKMIDESNFNKLAIQLSKILGKEPNLSNCLDLLDQALLSIDEIRLILQQKTSENDIEQQIVQIEDRLFEIRTLAKKHNINVSQLHSFYDESMSRLESINEEIFNEQTFIAQQQTLFEDYKKECLFLNQQRQSFAKLLEEKINIELHELISAKTYFKVDIETEAPENGSSSGIDKVRFLISINAGMPYMPIDQVASGGELSRIMLAIKSVLLKTTLKPTIIFDEIDTGVGGAIADLIGTKLKTLSKIAQIISITHQPQIASKADNHFFVYKTQSEEETFCNVKPLKIEEKIQEIARMLSGKTITQKTIDAAKEMIGS
jgi:DNA repair protein RecN (Recombination protein N)